MKNLISISLTIILLLLFSCNRIKNKGAEIVVKTKAKVIEKSNDLIDNVSPKFDKNIADTKYNKKRFLDFLKVEITPDIKNIYCYDDAIGIDASYQFSFNCNYETAKKIIQKHKLKLDKNNTVPSFGIQHNCEWWDINKIEKLNLYSWTNNDQYFKNFWYDQIEQKAYFFDFDM